jgi:hypothetical protein
MNAREQDRLMMSQISTNALILRRVGMAEDRDRVLPDLLLARHRAETVGFDMAMAFESVLRFQIEWMHDCKRPADPPLDILTTLTKVEP